MSRTDHENARGKLLLILLITCLCSLAISVRSDAQTSGTWSEMAPMPTARRALSSVALGGRIYAIAGDVADNTPTSNVERYDPATNSWESVASIPTPRNGLSTTVYNGRIYAVGGQFRGGPDPGNFSDDIEVYDPLTDTWSALAPMPTPRTGLAVVMLRGKIYTIGGYQEGHSPQVMNIVEIYDPATDLWSTGAPMQETRSAFDCVVIDEKIYAFSGLDGTGGATSSCEVYDPDTDTWTYIAPTPIKRSWFACDTLDGKAALVGGYLPYSLYPQLLFYDPTSNTWSQADPMPTPRHACGGASLSGTLFVVGGGLANAAVLNTVEAYEDATDNQGPSPASIVADFTSISGLPGLNIVGDFSDEESGNSHLIGGEYFIDHDPGEGRAVPLIAADGSWNAIRESFIPIAIGFHEVSDGEHTVYLRARDEAGNWGPVESVGFSTLSTDFDPLVDEFNFANWGVGRCSGMAWANEFFWRNGGIPLDDNSIPLVPPDDACPNTTAPPPLIDSYFPPPPQLNRTRLVIEIFQWGFMLEQAATRLATQLAWDADSSAWIGHQVALTEDLIRNGHNSIIYLAPRFAGTGKAGHAVLAYRTATLPNKKALFVYDPNYPNRCQQGFNQGLMLRESDGYWSPVYVNDVYGGYPMFSISDFWQEIHLLTMAVVTCPVDVELVTSLGGYVTKDSVSNPDFKYTVTSAFGETADSVHKVLYVGENYPKSVFNIRIIPHDTADPAAPVSVMLLANGSFYVIADSIRVDQLPSSGFLFSTLDTGSIAGLVSSNALPLAGLPVDLSDDQGNVLYSTVTGADGRYLFGSLDNGSYIISIATPLGFKADPETKEIVVKGLPHEVNFELTKLEIVAQQRTRGYWAHQLLKAVQNKPQDYSLVDFARFASLIDEHFNQNQLNPVDFYQVPQPASQADSLETLRKLLHMMNTTGDEPLLQRLAKSELMALMLNVVSAKVSQTYAITRDDQTISQVITYCDMLVNDEITPPDDGGPGCGSPWLRYIRASFILTLANCNIMIPAGMIPEDVIQIAYRLHADDNLPTDFSLAQNYPNPFNPTTTISFTLPTAQQVTLEVFNVLGQKVATVIEGELPAGQHMVTWDGSGYGGQPVASGIYLYRLQTGEFTETRKMMLLK